MSRPQLSVQYFTFYGSTPLGTALPAALGLSAGVCPGGFLAGRSRLETVERGETRVVGRTV